MRRSNWLSPIGFDLMPTANSESFRSMPWWPRMRTGVPIEGHVGSFGHVRRHHVHEGVDLYCPRGTDVCAVEAGVVVAIENFTGPDAHPPSPWWNATSAVLIEGESGVVVYGEIDPVWPAEFILGERFQAGTLVGRVVPVLKKDKGRPMSMLHLELHTHGTRCTYEWPVTNEGGVALAGPRPPTLLDPTQHLLDAECWEQREHL